MAVRAAFLILVVAASAHSSLIAQDAGSNQRRNSPQSSEAPSLIQDNSFLIEEAYNQEDGVVQHISAFTRSSGGNWVYSFTQEWPVFSVKHQLSFTAPLLGPGTGPTKSVGFGDLALNYRYQLAGDGSSPVAIAPRVSLLLPTGDEKRGFGSGGSGVQFNLPVSLATSRKLVTHLNAGITYVLSARNAAGEAAKTLGYNLGPSVIWLARSTFNVMLEVTWTSSQEVVGSSLNRRYSEFFVSPGLRWALNFSSGLQIVPGVAVPIGVGSSSGGTALFLYLSFEHPFKSQP